MARTYIRCTIYSGNRFRPNFGLDPIPAAMRFATDSRVRHIPHVLRVRPRAQIGTARGPRH